MPSSSSEKNHIAPGHSDPRSRPAVNATLASNTSKSTSVSSKKYMSVGLPLLAFVLRLL